MEVFAAVQRAAALFCEQQPGSSSAGAGLETLRWRKGKGKAHTCVLGVKRALKHLAGWGLLWFLVIHPDFVVFSP